MQLVFHWWLKRKAKEHRSAAVLFFAFAAAVTALLFAIVLQRSARPPVTYFLDEGTPDFQSVVSAASGEFERSYWRVSSSGTAAFVVGYRGERGAEVALVLWDRSRSEYRVASAVSLGYGAEKEIPKFTPVFLGDTELFMARLAQDNGWQSIYLLRINGEKLSLVDRRSTAAGVVDARPFVVGNGTDSCRSLRIGDVDGDGVAEEVLSSSEGDGQITYSAYRWQGGQLILEPSLSSAAEAAETLFADSIGHCTGKQGIYYDERDENGVLWTNFLAAEVAEPAESEPLFEGLQQ